MKLNNVVRAPGGMVVFSDEEMLAYLRQNVRYDGDCHIWAGMFMGTKKELPRIMWKKRLRSARRVLYELSRGVKLRSTSTVYSICGDSRCMNEEHLRAGAKTSEQYRAVMAKFKADDEGSRLVGLLDRASRSKLPVTEAHNVFEMLDQGCSHREIGERYGVGHSSVVHALKRWARAGVHRHTLSSLLFHHASIKREQDEARTRHVDPADRNELRQGEAAYSQGEGYAAAA